MTLAAGASRCDVTVMDTKKAKRTGLKIATEWVERPRRAEKHLLQRMNDLDDLLDANPKAYLCELRLVEGLLRAQRIEPPARRASSIWKMKVRDFFGLTAKPPYRRRGR